MTLFRPRLTLSLSTLFVLMTVVVVWTWSSSRSIDEQKAIQLAERALREKYGTTVERYRPFHARLCDGQWEVWGALPPNEFNFPIVVFGASDERMIYVGFTVH